MLDNNEVEKRIDKCAEGNWKVANLLRDVGPFFTWNETLQNQLLKIIKVKRVSCSNTGAVHFEELVTE